MHAPLPATRQLICEMHVRSNAVVVGGNTVISEVPRVSWIQFRDLACILACSMVACLLRRVRALMFAGLSGKAVHEEVLLDLFRVH